MSDKTFYVDDEARLLSTYGSMIKHLSHIGLILNLINSYINLEDNPLTIIDYGCAYGYYLQVLKLIQPEHQVYGVDIDFDAVNHARSKLGQDKIFWQSCEERIPLEDDSVDLILCIDTIEHILDNGALINMFKECNRLLKRDGYMFVTTPNCNLQQKMVSSLAGARWTLGEANSNIFDEGKLGRLVEPYISIHEVIYSYHSALSSRAFKASIIRLVIRLATKLKLAPSLILVLRKR